MIIYLNISSSKHVMHGHTEIIHEKTQTYVEIHIYTVHNSNTLTGKSYER